jgi:hypothetical protein
MALKVLFFAVFHRSITPLSDFSSSFVSGVGERIFLAIYVLVLSITFSLGAYLVATQAVFLISGQTSLMLQNSQ